MADAFQAARAFAASQTTGANAIVLNVPQVPVYAPDWVKQLISDVAVSTIRLALQELAGQVSDKAPVDSGALAQSFGADPATKDGGIEMLGIDISTGVEGRVFSSLPQAVVMDQGRRPGQPISMEGIDAIGLWAQRKLGMSREEASHAKWAIAHAIVAHGIEAKLFVEAGVAAARPRIEVMFSALSAEIGSVLTTKSGSPRTTFQKRVR
jgi:hypothetical protein